MERRTPAQVEEEIARLRAALAAAERERAALDAPGWPPRGFYWTYYLFAGCMLGTIGALNAVLVNVLGSLLIGQDPLRIIRVYATILYGEPVLIEPRPAGYVNQILLVLLLHVGVGTAAGAVFHAALNRYRPGRSAGFKIAAGAGYGLLMWIVNFYLVLSWLQPLLHGRAFVLEFIPWWVAALTHLAFGLTLGILEPIGAFRPYRALEHAP